MKNSHASLVADLKERGYSGELVVDGQAN